MNLDQDVRAMLRERADGVAAAPVVPDGTVRRVRVRKALWTGGVALGVAAIAVAGAFARSAMWTDTAPVPPAERSSRTESAKTIVEGNGEVHSRAVRGNCELSLSNCPDELPGDHLLSVTVSASEEGGEVSGSGSIEGGGLDDSFTIRCSKEVDDYRSGEGRRWGHVLMVGGTFDEGVRAGEGMALVIRDLARDRLAIWFQESVPQTIPGKDGCDWMLGGVEVRGLDDLIYEPVTRGNFTLGTVPPAKQEVAQMPIIRQMTNALNAKDTDTFMDLFVRNGWFQPRELFLGNRDTEGLRIKNDPASVEAWMAINEAWELEAEVIGCTSEPASPPEWNEFPPSRASARRDVFVGCEVTTRWHTLSLEVTEEWLYEFDGTTLLTWGTGLLDINPPDRTLPLGVDGLLDWESWLKANRPEDAGRYLSSRWTGPKRDDYMEPPYPACAHGGPCPDEWIDNRNVWDNTKFAPFANTAEAQWSINGQDYAPSGLVPYNPALADEIEASIQAYLAAG